MSIPEEKIIGQQILTGIDHLIEAVIAAELQGQQDARQAFDGGCRLIVELYNLLEKIIGHHPEYMETAVKELVAQRVPDQRLLGADFNALLDEMCRRIDPGDLEHYGERRTGIEPPAARDKVERALDLLFPREAVLKQQRCGGIYFEYYIPSLKIAVEECGSRGPENAIREFLCRRDGIRVVRVERGAASYREIARQIKRQLAVGEKIRLND